MAAARPGGRHACARAAPRLPLTATAEGIMVRLVAAATLRRARLFAVLTRPRR